jgi:hypothetical protein
MQGMKILLLTLLAFFFGSGESNPYHRSYHGNRNSNSHRNGFQERFQQTIAPTEQSQTDFEKNYEMVLVDGKWVLKSLLGSKWHDWNDEQARGIEDALPTYNSENEDEMTREFGNFVQDYQENNYDEYRSILDALGYDSNPFDMKSGGFR